MDENEILTRLVESERASHELLKEARGEAARRVREASAAADSAFSRGWEESSRTLEDAFRKEKEAILGSFEAEVSAYTVSLESRSLDMAALGKVALDYLERPR